MLIGVSTKEMMTTIDRIQGDVLAVISNSEYDFRTTDSLMNEFGVNRPFMVGLLDNLWREGKIRHPFGWERHLYGAGRNEVDWWRYTSRGPTRREKWRMFSALIGMQPISDGGFAGRVF